MYISKQPFRKSKQPFRKSKQTFHKSKQPFRKFKQPFRKSKQPFRKSKQPFRRRSRLGLGDRSVRILFNKILCSHRFCRSHSFSFNG